MIKTTLARPVSARFLMAMDPVERRRADLCVQVEVPVCAGTVNATEHWERLPTGGSVNVMTTTVTGSKAKSVQV